MTGRMPDGFDYLDAAYEMAATGRPTLARLLAEEAAALTTDPDEAAHILRDFPDNSLRLKDC
ncbi:hypothetical protein OIE63_23130 [Streptomyces sp. NBC_01795]|uniref:hypothetical protein n=1 Tax=Streptomyces sp. NBC_01795 TaxID=2975943 RepID=UPI002DD84307|nr:hypothetical protein [Streptomyces sp. NBC_01795]WSA94149.1 hypothetical protein OIE63_23130 [Streptomyces sp. NBC_01795]